MNARQMIGFAAGPIASAGLGLLIVPVTAWIFVPADIGRLNIFQIALSFALLGSLMGLDQAFVREYHESTDKAQLFIDCVSPGLLLLGVAGAISLAYASRLAQWLYADADPLLYVLTLAAIVSSYVSRYLSLILRMQERGWAYSVTQVVPRIIQFALMIAVAGMAFDKRFVHLLAIVVISLFTVMLGYLWNTRADWVRAARSHWDCRRIRSLMAFGLPLVVSGLAYWGLTAVSTIVLRTQSSLEELAVYSVAGSFAGAAVVMQSIFSLVWAPTVYRWVAEGIDMKIVDGLAHQGLALIAIMTAAFGTLSWICGWLLPVEYGQVKYILLCMLVPPFLYTMSEITSVGIGIRRRTGLSAWITLAAMACNVILALLLIPGLGAGGAAIGNAIAFFIYFIGRTEVSARIWRSLPRAQIYLVLASGIAMCVGTAMIGPRLGYWIHALWAAILIVAVFSFRTQWRELITGMSSRWKERESA